MTTSNRSPEPNEEHHVHSNRWPFSLIATVAVLTIILVIALYALFSWREDDGDADDASYAPLVESVRVYPGDAIAA